MSKFNVGEQFKLKGENNITIKIIFVPPIDNYGVRNYLCEVHGLNSNVGEKPVVSLKRENDIEENFVLC